MEKGLAEPPKGIIQAPKEMYVEVEQDDDVARGCVKVTELIAYDVVGKKRDDNGNIVIKDGRPVDKEVGRKPCFCQTKEQELIFMENNPDVRIETFSIQLLKSTAKKYLNDPENMKQFVRKEGKNG